MTDTKTTDTKKRILQLAKHYKLLSMLEGHAGDRDDMVAAEQYRVSGKKAWDELGVELDKMIADLVYWTNGTHLIEECLAKAQQADPGDVPFPLVGDEARLWHQAQAAAYQHALEMMGRPAQPQTTETVPWPPSPLSASPSPRTSAAT